MLIKTPFKILYFILFISSCSDSENEANAQFPVLNSETVEVYLLNTLNDSRGYCIDMMGYKTNGDINRPLQAHSCYSYQG